MSEELNKKIAEWVFERENCDLEKSACQDGHFIANDGKVFYGSCALPDFTESLDACFKYIVPKLHGVEVLKLNRYEQEWQEAFKVQVRLPAGKWFASADKTPALAFCKAVEKLIDSEEKP